MDENQTRICYKQEVGMGNLSPDRGLSRRRGRCIVCDKQRVLYGGICRECGDVEDETQSAHQLGLKVEAAATQAYQQWAARADDWTDRELNVAVVEGFIREYIEKAYTAGFWQGAYSMEEIRRGAT